MKLRKFFLGILFTSFLWLLLLMSSSLLKFVFSPLTLLLFLTGSLTLLVPFSFFIIELFSLLLDLYFSFKILSNFFSNLTLFLFRYIFLVFRLFFFGHQPRSKENLTFLIINNI